MKQKRMFCWHCGGDLTEKDGKLIFVEVTLPGGNVVKCHRICEQPAKDYQHLDTMPADGYYRTCAVCGCQLPDHWSWSFCSAHQPGVYE